MDLKDPGKVLVVTHQDLSAIERLVLREHEFGMSKSLLYWVPAEQRWRTVTHTVRLFQDAGVNP